MARGTGGANEGPAAHLAMSKIGCWSTGSQPASATEWAECQQPVSLPRGTWSRVQAINAQCIAKLRGGKARHEAICVALQECYDVLIEDVMIEDRNATSASLPESSLVIATPQRLLEVAVEFGWLSDSILDESRPELVDPGRLPRKYLVEPAYRTWLWELLEPRAEYWRARVNAKPFGFDLAKPEFVLRRLPATTVEGLLLQADEGQRAARGAERRKFGARRLIGVMLSAGVPPAEITIRSMLRTACEVTGDRAVPIELSNDWSGMAAEEGADPAESMAGNAFLSEAKDPALPQPAIVTSGGRGPKRDYETALKVAEVVTRLAPDGNWRAQLEDICEGLDDDGIRRPKRWKLKGHRTWSGCVIAERELVVKAIEHHRKRAQECKKTIS